MAKQNSGVVVEASGLSASYGERSVWQDADFKIHRGAFVAVLGPNGAGKTTLLRLILGLYKPAAGKLLLFGQSPKKGSQHIGYVPQRHLVDSEMRLEALELVRLGVDGQHWGLGSNKDSLKASMDALKAVDAMDLADRSLGQLSGGELQRIFLAQALVGRPLLLLLDEPLANLDVRRQTALINLIKKIAQERKMTVILIAHDINPLLSAMTDVIYMANGRIATGKPEQIINSETLSRLYDAPVEVLKDSRGRIAVLGVEEAAHPHG